MSADSSMWPHTRAKKALYIGTKKLHIEPERRVDGSASIKQSSNPDALLSSRFLEEMELEPTREVAREIVKAASGDNDNRLTEVLEQAADKGYRKILNGVEGIVDSLGSIGSRAWGFVRKRKRPAERPFQYQQSYDSPKREPKQSDTPSAVWPHIDLNRSRRPRRNLPD